MSQEQETRMVRGGCSCMVVIGVIALMALSVVVHAVEGVVL